MKALTVKNPWAWAIIHFGKDVENRSRPTSHRGRLYIHVAQTEAPEALIFPAFQSGVSELSPEEIETLAKEGVLCIEDHEPTFGIIPEQRGLVIGTVDVVNCHHSSKCQVRESANHVDGHYTGSLCSQWAMDDSYHWTLSNPRPLEIPFEARGKLGLWNVNAE